MDASAGGPDPVDALDLRALLLVVDHGGFRAAATATGLGQPSLTRRVTSVERRLGIQLVARSARGAALTREGRLLLPAVRRLLRDHAALLEAAATLADGQGGGARSG